MLTNDDIKNLVTAMQEVFPTAEQVKKGFDQVDAEFKKVHERLGHIEKILISKQDEKIEKLEKRIKRIEEMLPA